jgi:formate hydrogenlyase subunit 3/multisubunit Na+/H+ antiporter MnhD subunit
MTLEFPSADYRPLIAALCPTIAALLILLSRRRPNIRESCTLVGSVSLFLVVISMAPSVLEAGAITFTFLTIFPGVDFAFKVDACGLIFGITSSSLWILVSLYSIGYMRSLEEHAQTRYYFSFAVAILGAIGMAFSANLVTMFVFYEILTVSTYALVAHDETPEATHGGHKYLVYLLSGGAFLLFATLMTYSLVGTTDFDPQGILGPALGPGSRLTLQLLFFCFMLGFVKAAWMPIHSWLPTAMVAPTPVSALLHAVAVVKAGVFGIIKTVFYLYGTDLMHELGLGIALGCVASFTIIVANLQAIGQNNLKRLLAYSTINQLSFIILGAAILTPMSATGALIHIPFHGFMKITLFLCAGAITVITAKRDVSEMAGIGRQMPITMMAFTIAALGMCGAPPIAGFISKWHISLGAIEAGQTPFLFIILAGSLLDVVYFFPVIKTAFFERMPEADTVSGDMEEKVEFFSGEVQNKERERPLYLFMIIPLAITALFSIVFCLRPQTLHIYDLVQMAVNDIFVGR